MQRFAGVRGGHIFFNMYLAGFLIDLDLHRADADFPKQRIRWRRRHTAVRVPRADELTALIGKVPIDQFAIANLLAAGDGLTVSQCNRFFRAFEMLDCKFNDLPTRIAARQLDRFTHDRSRTARAGGAVERSESGIDGANRHPVERYP